MRLKHVFYAIAIIGLLIGAWGFYDRLVYGHQNAGYGSYIVWGLWVAMYLFFVGNAAGGFLVATLDLLFKIDLFRGTGRVALWTALVCLAAGLLLIWVDLGHMDRMWKLFLQVNFGSIMAQIVWGYTLFGLLLLVSLYLAIHRPESKALRALMIIGIPLSLFLSGGVGGLLGVQASQPFWHVGLFPVQFPVFSLASGVALVMAALGLFGPRNDPRLPQQLWILAIATVALAVVKLYFLWADYFQSIYGDIPQNVKAINMVLFGSNWWAFWILQLLIGTIIPIVVLVQRRLAQKPLWAGWMGVLVLFGFAVARTNIVFPALCVPEMDALVTAFSGPHLSFEYFPSPMEWAVTLGATALALLGFLIGTERLPLFSKEMA